MDNSILVEIKDLTIACPDCDWVEDDQYTCTTCWCQGGHGEINVVEYLIDKKVDIEKLHKGELTKW